MRGHKREERNLLAQLEHFKINKIANFGGEMLKYGKYRFAKLENFVYFCITRDKAWHFPNFCSNVVGLSRRNANILKLCRLKDIFPFFYNMLQLNFTSRFSF